MEQQNADQNQPALRRGRCRARCAGAATAMLLAREGARVLLLDRSRYGTDTLSTHAFMRGAVLHLHRWGLLAR